MKRKKQRKEGENVTEGWQKKTMTILTPFWTKVLDHIGENFWEAGGVEVDSGASYQKYGQLSCFWDNFLPEAKKPLFRSHFLFCFMETISAAMKFSVCLLQKAELIYQIKWSSNRGMLVIASIWQQHLAVLALQERSDQTLEVPYGVPECKLCTANLIFWV